MKVEILSDKQALGVAAAARAAELLRATISKNGHANVIVATGASQFEMLANLIQYADIRWDKVTGFHLDEYVGLPITHPASFRAYLWQRFISKLHFPMKAFHYVNGDENPQAECVRLGGIIGKHPIDVAFVGIGENGHLAFNDPPADFETEEPYLVVNLDEACRKQQMGEGWFPTISDVPKQAISMSCRQIMKSKAIVASVPDARKATAVKACLEGPISPTAPSSILQKHENTMLFLDKESAKLLGK